MYKSLTLVSVSLCVASVSAASETYRWNGASATNADRELWIGDDDMIAVSNPYANDAATKLASTAFGMTGGEYSVPLSGSGTFGNKIVFNGKTKLVLGDGSGKTTITLAGVGNGAKIVYGPGSGKTASDASTKFDVNCHANWVAVKSTNDQTPESPFQLPKGAACGHTFNGVFDPTAPIVGVDMSETNRPSGGRIVALINRNYETNPVADFNKILLGETAVEATCDKESLDMNGAGENIELDFGKCGEDFGTASEKGVQCKTVDGGFPSSCPALATITADDGDYEVVKVGDDYVVVNKDTGKVDPDVTPVFDNGDGVDEDPDTATHISLNISGVEYGGPIDAPIVRKTITTTTIIATTDPKKENTTTDDPDEDGDDEDDTKNTGTNPIAATAADKTQSSGTTIIVIVVLILALVVVGAIWYVKKNQGGSGPATAQGVVSFENPMYDDAKGMSNATYAQSGAGGQSGYMDVPAGGGGGGSAGYMDVNPNQQDGGGGYMDVNPTPSGGGGGGYMDVSPNAGGGFAESGYMDVSGQDGGGGYMEGSDGEEDV